MMPLFVAGKRVESLDSVKDIFDLDSGLLARSRELMGKAVKTVGPVGLLYVNQREYAVVEPGDPCLSVLGTDDATTCHMVVVRHRGSGVTGLAHCDGCDTQAGLWDMIEAVRSLSMGGPEGRLDVHLAGGFLDDRGESEAISMELLQLLLQTTEELHLETAAITAVNNTVQNGINFPIMYGLAVHVASGEIYPASFTDKGPDMPIRGATHFGGFTRMTSIYSAAKHRLLIGPYTWQAFPDVERWMQAPDSLIRRYLSTSPAQEPPHFAGSVRSALKVLHDHPSASSLFVNGTARSYSKHSDGSWILQPQD